MAKKKKETTKVIVQNGIPMVVPVDFKPSEQPLRQEEPKETPDEEVQ